MDVGTDEISEVLDRVRRWPPGSKISLARRILESLEPHGEVGSGPGPPAETPPRGVRSDSVVGLLATGGDPPDDEECRRIVEEALWQKYGP